MNALTNRKLGRTVGVDNPARRMITALENTDTANDWKLRKPEME